jgi:hypothetical protein
MGKPILGLDRASVDGNKVRNYPVARAAGFSFAFVRGSYERWADPSFAADVDEIRAAGMVAGAYAFPLPGAGHPTAREQMRVFGRANPIRRGDMPPVLDVEFPRGIASTGLSRPELLRWVLEAADELQEIFGVAPMIYTSRRVWDGEDQDALDADGRVVAAAGVGLGSVAALALAHCPLWLAQYHVGYRQPAKLDASPPWPPTPAAWGEGNHWVHQEQGDATGVPGFSSTIDLNRFRPMYLGETGPRVRWIQQRLGLVEGAPGVCDSVTCDAIAEYQAAVGLEADRVIGPRTFARLAWEHPAPPLIA